MARQRQRLRGVNMERYDAQTDNGITEEGSWRGIVVRARRMREDHGDALYVV